MSREAIREQIKEFEDELAKTKYNKRTQHHVGLVKAKIARLKEKSSGGGGKKGEGYSVKKTGDATVCLVGFPSVGKSTLLNKITNADSKTAAYAFTTLTVIPGIMEYESAKIQILDVPGIVSGAASGRGKGREVIAVMRSSDLIMIIADVFNLSQAEVLKNELYEAGIRINESPPNMAMKKTAKGGISIAWTVPHDLDDKTVELILKEYRIVNADVVIRQDITPDQLIDFLEENRVYIPACVVINKVDMADEHYINEVKRSFPDSVLISAKNQENLEALKKRIFSSLGMIKIFMKEVGKKADMDEPVIVKKGVTVKDICNKIHRDFVKRLRFCKVWGKSAKFPGQRFNENHVLQDEDVVQLHLR